MVIVGRTSYCPLIELLREDVAESTDMWLIESAADESIADESIAEASSMSPDKPTRRRDPRSWEEENASYNVSCDALPDALVLKGDQAREVGPPAPGRGCGHDWGAGSRSGEGTSCEDGTHELKRAS